MLNNISCKRFIYIYIYIYKCHDQVAFHINTKNDTNKMNEINNFQIARWVSPPEAMWRICNFVLNKIYPSVMTLQLHLENK